MRRINYVLAVAALSVSAAFLASCSKSETTLQPEEPQTIQFTATLAPKAEGTKAIAIGKDGENKEILNVAWAEGEQVAIYYQKTDDTYATATATVGTPNPDGSAPITATLTDAKGGTAKFVYPATLANTTGDIDEAALLNQNGNLTGANGISTKFDAATSTGTIVVRESEATVSGTVMMTNRVCICKFHFDILESAGVSGTERNFSPVIIRDGNGHIYTITSDKDDGTGGTRGFNRNDDVYVAMLPVSGKTVSFYTKYSNHYLYTASGTTLTAGKFYRNLSIDMVKDNSGQGDKYRDLRGGSITANDGDIIYQRLNTSATANTITIPDGYTVSLAGVNISATGSAGIICLGNATISIEGVNTVTTFANGLPAIQAGGNGTTLTIQGNGSLIANGSGAGIGGGYDESTLSAIDCGNITILSGTVSASGYYTGIGGGSMGSCGNILISGGIITANSGSNFSAIGSGYSARCGNITINGGTVTANGGSEAAAIGCSGRGTCADITITSDVIRVTANKGSGAPYTIGKAKYYSSCGTITIDGMVYYDGTAFQNGGEAYLAQSPLVYEPQH